MTASTNPDSATVLMAMSGGVDSSAAAILLQDAGRQLTGVTMKLFSYSMLALADPATESSVLDDIEDAHDVCRKLGIPHYTFNLTRQFETNVMTSFCQGYLAGNTPNPCIDCNKHLKFGALHQRRRELELDFVATGHYARIVFDESTGLWQLHRAKDEAKDQSYMLYHLGQDQLAHTLLPLGELTKDEARALAASRSLRIAQKEESQDICFVPNGDHIAFIEHHEKTAVLRPGPILDSTGRRCGTHQGLPRYTIGQRKGLRIPASEPLYVLSKDAAANALVVGTAAELLTCEVRARSLNFISGSSPHGPFRIRAKTHYRQDPQPAWAELTASDELVLTFDSPQRKAAPGQALVLYDETLVLGGGTIA